MQVIITSAQLRLREFVLEPDPRLTSTPSYFDFRMDNLWKDVLDGNTHTSQSLDQLALIRRTDSVPNDVITALEVLKSSPDVPKHTLVKVLEVERHPALIKLMRSPGTIPACMALVRRCQSRGELFTSHYAYLSLRCLLLSLEVSILMHCTARYAMASEQGHWTPTLRADVSRGVTSQINVTTDLNAAFLQWNSSDSGEPAIFPFAGGLTVTDMEFLIDTCWDERKALIRQFTSRRWAYWDKVDALQRRNYAVSPAVDRPMVAALFKPFSKVLDSAEPLSFSVDHDDTMNVLAAFRRNVDLVAADDAVALMLWLIGATNGDTEEVQYLSSLIYISRDLAVSLVERFKYKQPERTFTVQIGSVIIGTVSAFFQGLSTCEWLTSTVIEKTMELSQAIGISGQVYLLSLHSKLEELGGKQPIGIMCSETHQHEDFCTLISLIERIQILVSYARIIKLDSGSDFATLSLAHLDWSRIQMQFEMISALFNMKHSSLKEYVDPWLLLGRLLRFKLNSKHVCAYSRCFTPGFIPAATLLVCDKCQSAYYCSYACQRA
ncbi:hypothetical protein FRC12_022534 [Ceratobasidium sp. 428]|nr:hypothetical protein FRC12_022534 [Ceratobasidium sp. 428]